ncbi:hypothetical protein [Terrisporobacter petrolearius]|uniref:hypothetical protein n=1 Tax=Terrisporobacter petrolearius TaxID=1460447 RepID=UPI0022E957EC|nr:hypothetical protein [Terrisporobacter petrolearius]
MLYEKKVLNTLERAKAGIPLSKDDCIYFLNFDEFTMEASLMRSVANEIVRNRNKNSGIIVGQIGVETSKCPGNCKFCSFGEDHTFFEKTRISSNELKCKIEDFCKYNDLYGLYLMAMHNYDLDYYLNTAKEARKIIPKITQLWANVGDSPLENFQEMKKSGITAIYHVCRIGEGTYTNLKPENRIKTMKNALDAGLEVYTCCEPIGPEHTVEEIVENMFVGIELNCYQHAAMRRVAVPGSPLAKYGQITGLRLSQIVAVVALASLSMSNTKYIGVHEPNELSYISGANIITAESGANPRDTKKDTSINRGFDMSTCRKLLYECGFDKIRKGDESTIDLNLDYLYKTESF